LDLFIKTYGYWFRDLDRRWEVKKEILFEFCNINQRVPTKNEEYKNVKIASWLKSQKDKIHDIENEIYKKLCINEYVKETLDKNLKIKKQRTSTRFFLGMLLSALNFFPIPYYVVVSLSLASYGVFAFESFSILVCVLGAVLGSFLVFYTYISFFSKIENKKLNPELVHRPKRPKLLPNVLSKEEVKMILNAHGNIKHKAMLSLIYSCGLRRSELLNLKLSDIDSKRGLVIIKQSKGRKDRVAPLSDKILELLRDYYNVYKPQYWLFEGQDKTSQYDEKSLASVLEQALAKSGIQKPVSLHWLRHSYATHLLENGTDLRYIQEILGHSSSRTTEIYTHVSNKNIQRITSPFDNL
jgi:site-specific recombinase XerD